MYLLLSIQMYDEEVIKNFVRDFNLPIAITKEPYFSYFADLYEESFNIKNKLKLLDEVLDYCKQNNITFQKYLSNLSNSIMSYFEKNNAYKQFNHKSFICKQIPNHYGYYDDAVWSDDKYFITLDIVEANFTCLKLYNSQIVNNTTSWETFVKQFTSLNYFVEARNFRQTIFGKLNSANIVELQHLMLYDCYNLLTKNGIKVYCRNGEDELVLQSSKETFETDFNLITNIMNQSHMKDFWKVSKVKIKKTYEGFIKESNNKIELKCVSKHIYAQVYKHINNLELDANDLKFTYMNRIATFDTTIFS